MKKIKLAKNQKTVLIILAVIIFAFALVNIAWLYMYFKIYRPIVKKDQFNADIGNDNPNYISYSTDTITAPNGDEYNFYLSIPRYLHFSGQLEMSHVHELDPDKPIDHYTDLVCCPKLFSSDKLYISVMKTISYNNMAVYDVLVDENLNLINQNSYSETEEMLYKEYSDEAKSLYDFFESFFGYKPEISN